MPPLHAELSAHLDVSSLAATLRGDLEGAAATLRGLPPVALEGEVGGAASGSVALDTSGLSSLFAGIAGRLRGLAGDLPLAGDVLRELEAPLALLETVTTGDLEAQIRNLLDRMQAELVRPADSGMAGVLTRVVEILASAPEGASLWRTLSGWLAAGGLDARGASLPLRDIAGAFDAMVRLLAGLLTLETDLHEGERLSAILAARLDAGAIQARFDLLLAGPLGRASLALAASGDAAALAVVERGAMELDSLLALTAESMAFGEATLLYLDLPRLRSEIEAVAAAVQRVDLAPLTALIAWLAERLAPLLEVSLDGLPQLDFAGVLALLEERGEALAAELAAAPLDPLTAPLREGFGRLGEIAGTVTSGIGQAQLALRAALAPVSAGLASLPTAEVSAAVGTILAPLRDLLAAVRQAVAALDASLGAALATAKGALETAEIALGTFERAVKAAFEGAAARLDEIGLEGQVGALAGAIRDFSGRLAEADLQPVFEAASGAIEDVAGVVAAVPFDLLPDSMEAEVVAAIRPVKAARPRDLQAGIVRALEEPPIEEVLNEQIAEVGALFRELIEEIRKFDPRALATTLNGELAAFAAEIQGLSPHVALEPLEGALAALRSAVAGFDLDPFLAPVDGAFAQVEGAVAAYGPAALVAPLETRLAAARAELTRLLRLDQAEGRLDEIVGRGKELLAAIEPKRMERQLAVALAEARGYLEDLPLPTMGGMGAILASFLAGTGVRCSPSAFDAVARWFSPEQGGGTGALRLRAQRIAAAVAATHGAVQAIDPRELLARLTAESAAFRAAIVALPGGSPLRLRLEVVAPRLAPADLLASLAVNRERYLAVLAAAVAASDTLQRLGLAEVDAVVASLRGGLAPLSSAIARFRAMLARSGVPGLDGGLSGLIAAVFAAVPSERLAALATPILRALHGRLGRFLDELAAPLKQGLRDVRGVVDSLTLAPLVEALTSIQGEVAASIAALSPRALLAPVLADVAALQAELAGFDPLAAIEEALTALRDGVARLLGKLDAEALLRSPIEIYERLLALLASLDVEVLLAPVIVQVGGLIDRAEAGLEETIVAFEHLQAALPSQVGSTSVSASGSVSVG